MRPRRKSAAIAIPIALCAYAVTLSAQAKFDLPLGQRVKVEYDDSVRLVPIGPSRQQLTGVLTADSADAVQLRLPTGDVVTLRRESLKRAWVSNGVSRGRSAFAMALSLSATGYLTSSPRSWRGESSNGDGLIGAAIGAGIGTALGLIRPFETWKRVRR